VFLVVGALQLFLVLQARVMAQYAAYKAVRAGSLMHGNCLAMKHTAIAVLLPSITRTDSPLALANAFFVRRNNRYADGNPRHTGQIVELYRESPRVTQILAPDPEDNRFDQPPELERLEVRMLFWYRLKIPFADWVMSRMFLAEYGLRTYTATNPLIMTQKASWSAGAPPPVMTEAWPGGNPGDNMLRWADAGAYLVPIRVTASMRMMVPPRKSDFPAPECPL
jgi:hypothetical protein